MPALDGLRGLAILLVIPHNTSSGGQGLARFFTLPAHAGWVGVQLFFVLSGFLITLHLLESLGSPNYYRAFYARRTLRIFPLYYATLALLFVVLPLGGFPVIKDSSNQVWLWTYLSNWTDPLGLAVLGLGHFWSLAVEEQFYLIWPFLVATFSPRLWGFCLTLAAVALASRFAMLFSGVSADVVYHFTFCRMDALVLGAAAAVAFRSRNYSLPPAWPDNRLFWTGAAIVLTGAAVTDVYADRGFASISFGFSVLSVAFAMMVLAAAAPGSGWWRTVLEAAPLRSVGKYSYAMYIFHLPIHMIWQAPLAARLSGMGNMQVVAYMALVTAFSYLAAVASYHLLEKHFLKLKTRFVASPPSVHGRLA